METFQTLLLEELKIEELSDKLMEAIQNNELDEGFFSSLIGGTIGFLAGPALGKAIAKVLGITEGGVLYNILTSKAVTTSLGIAIANSTKPKAS